MYAMSDRDLRRELRDMIEDHVAPDEATEKLCSELPLEWQTLIRPFVHRVARDCERRATKKAMTEALREPVGDRAKRAMAELSRRVYKLPDGTRISTDDLTVEDIQEIRAGMRKHVGSVMAHIDVLDAMESVLAESGAQRLGDVPEWGERVRERLPVDGAQREALDAM